MSKRILIATASKHGSTFDIGDEIARVLSARGFDVSDKPIDEVNGLDGYEAVIVGSAVYVGRWMPEAIAFVHGNTAALGIRAVWLFSSGPIGDPPKPTEEPQGISELVAQIGAREHRIFAGRVDPELLGLGERAIIAMVRAPKGDYRDFAAVRSWAESIADELDGAVAVDANGYSAKLASSADR